MSSLWDVLVGAATGGTEQLDKVLEQRRKLQQIMVEAQSKAMYPDPITQLLMRKFGLIPGQPQDQEGNQGLGSMALNRLNAKGFSLSNPEAEAKLAADKALAVDRAKSEANIPAAIRDLDVIHQQFNEAFPPLPGQENEPAIQRVLGQVRKFGTIFGFPKPTPQQTGVIRAMPLAGIGLVRLAGALGRVTNVELQMAEQALSQQNLTPTERFETAKTLARQYIARIAPGDWNRIVKDNPDLPDILKKYDLAISQFRTGSSSPESESAKARLRAKYAR